MNSYYLLLLWEGNNWLELGLVLGFCCCKRDYCMYTEAVDWKWCWLLLLLLLFVLLLLLLKILLFILLFMLLFLLALNKFPPP